MAIAVSNGGSTITNTGTITGNVSLGATTFNNNSGGIWNLNGFNSFGVGSTINNNAAAQSTSQALALFPREER